MATQLKKNPFAAPDKAGETVGGGVAKGKPVDSTGNVAGETRYKPVLEARPKFRFPRNTPEGVAERRKKDRERKQTDREHMAALVQPAPLPSIEKVVDSPSAPGAVESGLPLSPLLPGTDAAPIPWDVEQLRPLFNELIETIDEARGQKAAQMATEAELPKEIVRDASKNARMGAGVKKSYQLTTPKMVAQAANAMGISGKYSDIGIFVLALTADRIQQNKFSNQLRKTIAEFKAQKKEPRHGTP